MARKRTKAQPKRARMLHRPPMAVTELDSRLRSQASRIDRISDLWLQESNNISELRRRVDILEAWMDRFANRRNRRGAA